MNSNQRSETNNQTENGANKKGMAGSKGNTTDGPLDHTYPQGAAQQQGDQNLGGMGTQQSGAGPGIDAGGGRDSGGRSDLPGGSMQTQQTGGTGAVQGVSDSHQQAMEQRSGAYGQLEQPVGDRARDQASTCGSGGGGQHGPHSNVQSVQGGSMGAQQSATPSGTNGGGQLGRQTATSVVQQSGSTSARQSVDRAGSQTGSRQQQDGGGTHQSNDVTGGLPRSPGNSGPSSGPPDTHLTGAQIHADQQKAEGGVHNSNDLAGGYPKSPGGANKLAADENMDDDTGFSNRG